jgi:hypothetical protein
MGHSAASKVRLMGPDPGKQAMPAISLPAITALARAGAAERGWELFVAGGYLTRDADPAALAVKGRLLKARGQGGEPALFAEAAAAYAAAHALEPAPYLAINAATLDLLAGNAARAQDGARAVLALLDMPVSAADTPYFLAATRAEALLLLGDAEGAGAALHEAAIHAPEAWHDRAATLRQLRGIATAQGSDPAWLDRFAPPASLHYAGHMGLAADGKAQTALAADLAGLLARERIGFAWGALAAGADIVIAEELLEAGCAVHAVLPCAPELFAAQSVTPAGDGWTARYRALLGRVASLRVAAGGSASVHDPLSTSHAGELAIGGALLNAATLGGKAIQLIVADEHGGGANTARQAALWREANGRQLHLQVPRDAEVAAMFPPERPDPQRKLAMHLLIRLDSLARAESPGSRTIAEWGAPIAAALAGIPAASVRAAPGEWQIVIEDFNEGLALAGRLLADAPEASLGLDLSIAALVRERASGSLVPYGPGPGLARRLALMAPQGVALASDALAATMRARGPAPLECSLYHLGEADLGGAIHALARITQ